MKEVVMDIKNIENFDRKINKNEFVLFKYKDVMGKMQWNCIRSSVDWIKVSVNAINKICINDMDIDEKCMKLYNYISCIDIIFESIQQLHRIFFEDNNLEKFLDTDNIFKNKISEESDNKYFKTIRSAFGAHPVNLNEPKSPNDKKLKRYASNPFDNRVPLRNDNRDFSVRLYSNVVGEDNIDFPIWISELEEFIKSRYLYLNDISKQIDIIIKNFNDDKKNIIISTSEDSIEQINILLSECKIRLNNRYYSMILEFLKEVFGFECLDNKNQEILEWYSKKLVCVIDEIKDNLQNMKFTEIKSYEKLEDIPDSIEVPKSFHYAIEKLSNSYYGESMLHTQYPIEEFLMGVIDFSEIYNLKERYILTQAGICYKINKETI